MALMIASGNQASYDLSRTGIAALGGFVGSAPQAGLAYFGARTASNLGGSAAVGAQFMQPSTFSQQATMGFIDTAATVRAQDLFAPTSPPASPSQNLQQFASPSPGTSYNSSQFNLLPSIIGTSNYSSGGSAGTVGRIK